MSKHVGHKRRHYFIDAGFQVPVAAVMAVTGLAMISYHLAIVRFLVATSRAGRTLDHYNTLLVLPLLIALLFAIVMLAILVSHRVVGPAYRLVQTVDSYKAGKLDTRANLRKRDALKDVANAVNSLGTTMGEQRAARIALFDELKQALGQSSGDDGDDGATSIIERLEALDGIAHDTASEA